MQRLFRTLAFALGLFCIGCGGRSSNQTSPATSNSATPAQTPSTTFKGISNHYEAKDPQ